MSYRQLVAASVVLHFASFLSFAQSNPTSQTAPSPEAGLFQRIVEGKVKNEMLILAGTVAAGSAVWFVILLAVRGRGDFHVNQFRVYFTVKGTGVEPSILAQRLEDNFEKAFAHNSVARASRPYADQPEIVQFTLVLRRARLFKWFMETERKERVEISHPLTGSAVFQARTLGINEAGATEWHFLSGLRSWRISEANDMTSQGEPAPDDEDVLFLETAALERFSAKLYNRIFIGRRLIRKTWWDFLNEALGQFEVTVVPVACKKSTNQKAFTLGGHRWKETQRSGLYLSDSKVQIWWRESSYPEKNISSLGNENYASRLFNLHPGLRSEYNDLNSCSK